MEAEEEEVEEEEAEEDPLRQLEDLQRMFLSNLHNLSKMLK